MEWCLIAVSREGWLAHRRAAAYYRTGEVEIGVWQENTTSVNGRDRAAAVNHWQNILTNRYTRLKSPFTGGWADRCANHCTNASASRGRLM